MTEKEIRKAFLEAIRENKLTALRKLIDIAREMGNDELADPMQYILDALTAEEPTKKR